tara:strand:+ start:52 stop:162 length:111 start_codon:yes stop_codon:yes gene_type:complete
MVLFIATEKFNKAMRYRILIGINETPALLFSAEAMV